jgi:hypothetical protein
VNTVTSVTPAVCDLSFNFLGMVICAIGPTAIILVPAITVLICAVAWRIYKGGTLSLILSSFAMFLVVVDLVWRFFHG